MRIARKLGASELELKPLWASRVHGPFTTGPLLRVLVTSEGKDQILSRRVVLIFVWKGPCGDSARCEASAGKWGSMWG